MSDQAKFATAAAAKPFILGGNATVTLVSLQTGTRFTYRIRAGAAEPADVWFVSVLTGSDNEADYKYLGRIDSSMRFWGGRKNPRPGDVSSKANSSIAFTFVWGILQHDRLHGCLEIWHEGRCGRCNRKLTVPASIESGFGPECVEMI